jgi:hypothetical protein
MSEKNRCEQCKKKVGIIGLKCKCNKLFCVSHLQAELHGCNYDYKKEGQENLKKIMEVGPLTQKMDKI